jgi:SAM-dependent methyltransferase
MEVSAFYTDARTNGFDNLEIDVPEIFRRYPVEDLGAINRDRISRDRFAGIYRSRLIPLKARLGLWDAAFLANLDLGWFEGFSDYWTKVLGGRPLWSPQDIYFLKNIYRMKFQRNTLPDTESADIHLKAWQRPELLYFLLHLLTKRTARQDVGIYKAAIRLRGKQTGLAVLEYGCGLAPFAHHALKFLPSAARNTFFLADLAMLPFHYGAWRMAGRKNIHPHLLRPENAFQATLKKPMDLIFCIQVFEHMNQPLRTIEYFHTLLKPGGVLVFDFILSEAKGLDSIQGTQERSDVLDFVRNHFEMPFPADLSADRSLPLTYVVKK